MIVRKQGKQFILIRQYDHCLAAGVFALHFKARPTPYESVLYAVKHHDIGWRALDETVRWNDETNAPYSFIDCPWQEKIPAYTEGIDRIAQADAYAGMLASMHFVSFFRDAEEEIAVNFCKAEAARQQRLRQLFTARETGTLNRNLRFLQLCDNLSLFVCLNQPGENTFPWFRRGFTWEGKTYTPIWNNRTTLSLSPNPFTGAFEVTIPYQVISDERQMIGEDRLTLRIE